jgi:uncharacterized membrane protein YbaN (DUF454 family)
MDSNQARQVLALYRPGTADATDPDVVEALAQTRQDSDLRDWYMQHCAFQKAVRARFQEIAIPEGLAERILTGQRPRIISVWWRRPEILAVAAAVVVLFSLAGFWFGHREDVSFSAYRGRMVRHALRGYQMEVLSTNLNQIREFLAKERGPADYTLTADLEKLPGEGGAVLSWQGHPVSMICFDLGDQRDLYLFVIHRSALANAPHQEPELAQVNKLMTASWTLGDKAYLLAGPGDQDFIGRFSKP